MMNTAKPIETQYRGYRFRSRLEARWAIFFDALGVVWDYELEGFKLGAKLNYLPDFWLPQVKMWGEVKLDNLSPVEMAKCYELARKTGHECILLIGVPENKPYVAVGFTDEGIKITEYCLTNHENSVYEEGQFFIPKVEADRTWDDTARAANMARQARFEYGETPRIPGKPLLLHTPVPDKDKALPEVVLEKDVSGGNSNAPQPPVKRESVYMITVRLRATENKTIDTLRIKKIFAIASKYPGRDWLAFHIFESGRGRLVEFPNFTTGFCPELISRLNFLAGAENVRVEHLVFD